MGITRMIRRMVMEFMSGLMEGNIKEDGLMGYRMEGELVLLLMDFRGKGSGGMEKGYFGSMNNKLDFSYYIFVFIIFVFIYITFIFIYLNA